MYERLNDREDRKKEVYYLYLIPRNGDNVIPIIIMGLSTAIDKAIEFKDYYYEVNVTSINSSTIIFKSKGGSIITDLEIINTGILDDIISIDEIDEGPYFVYYVDSNGRYSLPSEIDDTEEALLNAMGNVGNYKEVIITDLLDFTLFHSINGEIIFPELSCSK